MTAEHTSERVAPEWTRILVRVEHVVEVFVDLDQFDGDIAAVADYSEFNEFLGNRMDVVEFDGWEVLTDPDEIARYEPKARWELVATYKAPPAASSTILPVAP
mgnify:CR=1 FL=1